MKNFKTAINQALKSKQDVPFYVFTSHREQHLINVPILKPSFIFVLDGEKEIGSGRKFKCSQGEFAFFSSHVGIEMRNIPKDKEYYAVIIEFEDQDFEGLKKTNYSPINDFILIGKIENHLSAFLFQLIEVWRCTPKSMWHLRRKEMIMLLCHLGYSQILSMVPELGLVQKVNEIILNESSENVSAFDVSQIVGMSESTLRRKLKTEGTSFQILKDNVLMGKALALIQSTFHSVGYIAGQCGYQSQSRFTKKFKLKFGLTPSELRKTRLTE
jgi:AraC-like DNA-binding protein